MRSKFKFNIDRLRLFKRPKELSTSSLAFLGDGVYSLMTREYIVSLYGGKSCDLHQKSVEIVNASYQSKAADKIFPRLTESEKTVFLRGRNFHTSHTPKNKTKAEYHLATALETLFGWLYINGQYERLKELFSMCV